MMIRALGWIFRATVDLKKIASFQSYWLIFFLALRLCQYLLFLHFVCYSIYYHKFPLFFMNSVFDLADDCSGWAFSFTSQFLWQIRFISCMISLLAFYFYLNSGVYFCRDTRPKYNNQLPIFSTWLSCAVNEDVHLALAHQKYRGGNYRKALEHCNAVYEKNPRRTDNLLLLGAIYFQVRFFVPRQSICYRYGDSCTVFYNPSTERHSLFLATRVWRVYCKKWGSPPHWAPFCWVLWQYG